MSQDTDTEFCLWKTSKAEIDHEAEQLRSQGISIPENLDYEEIARRYKKSLEYFLDGKWLDLLTDSIKESTPSES